MYLEVNLIQPPVGVVSPNLTPYLWGYVWQEQEITLVLDLESIVNSPLLKNNF